MRRTSLLGSSIAILARLPLGFLLPFLFFALGWTFYLFKELRRHVQIGPFDKIPVLDRLEDIIIAFLIVGVYLLGLVAAYNLAVLINWLLVRYGLKPKPMPPPVSYRPSSPAAKPAHKPNICDNVHKIGIVLAGGGAKGAFQAGAMKAIYQFLAERDALSKVKVISATSIGSWNALFWLADLVVPPPQSDGRGAHERWWRSISLRSLVAPSWYVPAWRNAFLVTTPWQRQFDDMFRQPAICRKIARSDIHFYLTNSQVASGRLGCTTNNANARDLPRVKFRKLDLSQTDDAILRDVRDGVFVSMDLPPLFPYMDMDEQPCEDGGVIDNLPVMFAAMESCDLIFVLPLNSDFNAQPNPRSLLNRLVRVMDVRQGALERNSMKVQYLYNELAVLRKYSSALADDLSASGKKPDSAKSETLKCALRREHNECHLFAICPQRGLVERTINTHELWKSKEAGVAFTTMYDESMLVLRRDLDPASEPIAMAIVDGSGRPNWVSDF